MRLGTLAASVLILTAVAIGAGQTGRIVSERKPDPAEDFRRSDPALLSATGRPQLVEFFHPT